MPSPRWALLSIGAALATIALQFAAYYVTRSVGVLSAAAESLVNLASALVLFIALQYASHPPDESHAYGHEKVEYFSSGFEGALILIAALGIFAGATPRLVNPASVEQLGPGIGLTAIAAAINLAVALLFLREGTRRRSLALLSDGHHLLADVYTTVGVIVGLAIVALTNQHRLDAVIAFGVGAYILRTAIQLLSRSFHGLMDRALDPDELATLHATIEQQLTPGMAFHALRTRRVGPRRVADVHLLVPGDLSVRDGHDLATTVERAVEAALADTEITVHVEPAEGDRGAGHLAPGELAAATRDTLTHSVDVPAGLPAGGEPTPVSPGAGQRVGSVLAEPESQDQ